MKHTTKRILVLLLALLMALSAVSFAAAAQTEIVARGKYGTNITWTLDADGTLTITGNGNMDGYSGNAFIPRLSPWHSDSRIKTAVVSRGITSVGAGAFLGCENLKTVVLPESLKKVYASAFSGCTALQYVLFAGGEAKWDQIWTEVSSVSSPKLQVVISFPRPVQNDTPQIDPDIRFGVIDWGSEDGVVWIWDDSKTLTFTGSGAIPDHPAAAAPWSGHASEGIRRIVLEQGITDARGIGSIPENTEELIVLNPTCDISALEIEELIFLRGYLDSTAENYAVYAENCLFLPLCPADHRHTVVPDAGSKPTSCAQGFSAGLYCVDCGKFFYGHLSIPALTDSGAGDTVGEDAEAETAYAMTSFIAWLAKLLAFFRNT